MEIDGGPIGCGTLAEHVGEGDAPKDNELRLQHAVAPLATASRRFGVIAHPPVGDHPGREPANDQEARYRQDQQLLAQRDAQSHRRRSDDRTDEGATAPRAMETWHQHPAGEPLDRDRLGVHRHVEHPLEEAPEQERDEEGSERTGEPDEWSRDAITEQGQADHRPASHSRQDAGSHHHGQDRADGGPEHGESEPAVAEAEVLFQLRYVGRPGGEQEAVHEEHGDDGEARPAVHRRWCRSSA